MSPAARIDHIILSVPDIERAHHKLLDHRFAEAWPIGEYWPSGRTSGIALGGLNLELMQPEASSELPRLRTIVYQPTSIAAAKAAYGEQAVVFEKVEGDPDKLAKRGFPEEMRNSPQRICTNISPGELALGQTSSFFCKYAPFLAEQLGPCAFPQPFGPVREIRTEIPIEFAPKAGARLGSGPDEIYWERYRLDLRSLELHPTLVA